MASPVRRLIQPGENSRLDVQSDINGGILFTITQPHNSGQNTVTHVRLSRQNSIDLAISLLSEHKVPIEEIFRRLAPEKKPELII